MFLFATVGFIIVQLDRQKKQRAQQLTGSRTEYLRYLANVRKVAREAANQQRRALTWHHPDPSSLPSLADERSRVWLVLHSGSRGIGNQLAQMHIAIARRLSREAMEDLEDIDLASFVQGTPEFERYVADMLWAQDYALANREQMMDRALRELVTFVGAGRQTQRINCHHNFTQPETFDGVDLWITRKGAIKADVGDLGVIPGSMGTSTYIVAGKGNAASWNSCSHGAGRRFSRTRAKKLFTTDDLAEQMSGKVWLEGRADKLVDEIPSAYKDIDQVMADQADLVEVRHTLHQVLNYKGT
jgi:tRNA-splicing ligase RtcB